jgi:hypothetical protein
LNNASVGTLDNISSPYLLVPIAVFSILRDQRISRDEEKLLVKWFYLAHMRGHFGMGSSESILDADLAPLFRTQNLQDLIDVLRAHIKKFDVDTVDIAYKNKNSAFFSMLYFIMRQQKLQDWQTGLSLINNTSGKYQIKQHDHIFPQSLLKKENYENREINEISNIAFLSELTNIRKSNKSPSEYFKKEVIPKWGVEALTSQLIPTDESLWEMKNYRHFLEFRHEAIANYMNEFMKRFDTQSEDKPQHKRVYDQTPYGIVKNLETQLRLFIEGKLSTKSVKWWSQRVPEDVRTNAEIRKQKNDRQWPWYESYDEPIMAYVDFADYLKIIIRADNWNEFFRDVFREQELISAKFKELNPIRNKIAHSRDLTEQDTRRLRIHAEDILISIQKNQRSAMDTMEFQTPE